MTDPHLAELTLASAERGAQLEAALAASRTGIVVFGPDRRIVLSNRAFALLLDQDPSVFPPGMTHADMLRLLADRGEFTNIDAARHIQAMLADDPGRPRNFRRTRPNGRILESVLDPLPDGGYVIQVSDVTSLVEAEQSAAAHGRLLTTVLGASRAGMAVYGPDHRLLLHNAAYEAMLDFQPGDLRPGLTVRDVMAQLAARGEFGAAAGPDYVEAVLAIDRTRPHRRRRARPNGLVLDFFSDPLPDGGFVLTVTDVTLLAAAEDEARTRAALMENVLAALPQGISLFGPDRRLRLANPAYGTIMGDSAARLGESMADLIERRRRAGEYGSGTAGDSYAADAQQDYSRPARRRRKRPDGTTIDVRTAPLPDGGHVSVVTDVTLEVAAQAEIERRTAMFDLMMGHVTHGLMLFDANDCVVTFNAKAETLAGIAPGWLRAGTSREAIIEHLESRGIYGSGGDGAALAERLRGSHPRLVPRFERTLPDGRVIEQQADPTPDGGYVLALWDVTWRRETEAQLRAAKDAAEAASRAKSSFLASVSHELRTPLNAVIGFSEAIAHEAENPAEDESRGRRIGEYAHAVNDAGRHLLALINDILDVARIESGRVELSDSRVDIAQLIGNCRRMMDPAARAAQVRLETDLPETLPRVTGDERRLRQILLNLVSNAVKFTPAGGWVRLAATTGPDGGLSILVGDSGIGIAEDDIARAFEPFTQLEQHGARRAGGSGLGLFLSRALAAAHGGTLELESRLGHGTTAILSLPPARVLADEAGAAHIQPPETNA